MTRRNLADRARVFGAFLAAASLVASAVTLAVAPAAAGARAAGTAAASHLAPSSERPAGHAYWMVGSDGGVFTFGDAPFAGSTGSMRLNSPIIGMAVTPTGRGYWLAGGDGGIFSFGDARFHGSMGGRRLNSPVVAVTSSTSGNGYWLAASDGGVFSFGDARFHGSMGGTRLNSPIVAIAQTPTGGGYWLVAADGGVFSFGDARFHGSTGSLRLNSPVVGATATPTGGGYWLVAADGGVFSFGDARFHGSTGNLRLNAPIVDMAATPTGHGYWLIAADGGTFTFGDAQFLGSMGGTRLNRPVVAGGAHRDMRPYEVWLLDQAPAAGKAHIYDGSTLAHRTGAATAEVIDLGGAAAAMCVAETGAAPVRAHMLLFNETGTHAIISYVASGHVLFMDAASRTPVKCIRASAGAGGARQAHAAFPVPGDLSVLVANQNGKLLERIDTDADGDGVSYESAADIAHDTAATLNLATCTTPNGQPCEAPDLRPDNAPICPIVDASGRLVFVTLRGGGLLVVDANTSPMAIVAEYDRATIHANGCGGAQSGDRMYINSGGGTPANPTEFDIYSFSLAAFPKTGFAAPNQPAPSLVLSRDDANTDAHGMAFVPTLSTRGQYLWALDRFANTVDVIDSPGEHVVTQFSLAGAASSDPAPDLIDFSPSGTFAFVSLRGPCPLTANAPAVNNAVGATPGVGVIDVHRGGASGRLASVAQVFEPAPANFDCPSRTDDTPGSITNAADPHGVRVRLIR
ncbi:MAG TPA: hypothetical protein VM345_15380 [Acidimicrobiales bacterium]|nr:hypothetical protein [Acidimicrobiales bacterium]